MRWRSGAAARVAPGHHRGRITAIDSTAGGAFGLTSAAASPWPSPPWTLATATGPGGTFTGGTAPVETYSSGPRKMFYQPNSTAIAGSLLFATNGGTTLQKVVTWRRATAAPPPRQASFHSQAPRRWHHRRRHRGPDQRRQRPPPTPRSLSSMNASALDIEAAGWDATSGGRRHRDGAFVAVQLHHRRHRGWPGRERKSVDAAERVATRRRATPTAASAVTRPARQRAVTMGTQPAARPAPSATGQRHRRPANVTNVAVSCVDLPPSHPHHRQPTQPGRRQVGRAC